MTIEQLWKNLEPLVGKVEKLEPLFGKVEKLEPKIGKIDSLELLVKEIKDQVYVIQGQLHGIKDVNMTSMIKEQSKTREDIKEVKHTVENMEKSFNQKIDRYLQKDEVEHKKFEYEIANLQWKSKIAN